MKDKAQDALRSLKWKYQLCKKTNEWNCMKVKIDLIYCIEMNAGKITVHCTHSKKTRYCHRRKVFGRENSLLN